MSAGRRFSISRGLLALVLAGAAAACGDHPVGPAAVEETPELSPAEAELAFQAPPAPDCIDAWSSATDALLRVCIPEYGWNGDVVVWGHGYVAPGLPLALPEDRVGDQTVEEIVVGLRYGYATTSYRDNGLVAADAVDDLDEALDFFVQTYGEPGRAYLAGGSEGGAAAGLSLERAAPDFDAGLILCAPVGNFRRQIDYFGDVRILFDVYFPGLIDNDDDPTNTWLPWGAAGDVTIPMSVMAGWDVLSLQIARAIQANPAAGAELARVAGLAVDPYEPTTLVESLLATLWYNVFATNDAAEKLGGNPFDNRFRWYRGSSNDFRLNRRVQRVRASATALANLARYETDGDLSVPSVGVHTTLDPVVPFGQGLLYRFETLGAGVGFGYNFLPVRRYGHCAFEAPEVLGAFALMVLKATGRELLASAALFDGPAEIAEFERRAGELGADPTVVPILWR